MDPITIIMGAKAALNAAEQLNTLLKEGRGVLSARDEAELQPILKRLREQNDELYATVDEKLAKAAGEG